QQDLLDKLESVADSLPQVLHIGGADESSVDFLRVAQGIIGESEAELFDDEDMAAIRTRLTEISERIASREAEIEALLAEEQATVETPDPEDHEVPGEDRLDRKSTRLNYSHVKSPYAALCLTQDSRSST